MKNLPLILSLSSLGIFGLLLSNKKKAKKKYKKGDFDLPVHVEKTYKKRSISKIDTIVIHHTAGSEKDTPKAIAKYHIDVNDWAGIGYHYLIEPSGRFFQTNELETISYHTKSYNTRGVGISLIGNYSLKKPYDKQLIALRHLINLLEKITEKKLKVRGHRELTGTTECPGLLFDLDDFRKKI